VFVLHYETSKQEIPADQLWDWHWKIIDMFFIIYHTSLMRKEISCDSEQIKIFGS
jgi:hypothetical protein